MKNIELVTEYIKKNTNEKTLEIVKNKNNKKLVKIDKDYWRCYKCIDCGNTYEHLDNKETFYEVGKTIGRFQKNLSNFPLHKLNQTIKDFHDTKKRYDKLITLLNKPHIRINDCQKEIYKIEKKAIEQHKPSLDSLLKKYSTGGGADSRVSFFRRSVYNKGTILRPPCGAGYGRKFHVSAQTEPRCPGGPKGQAGHLYPYPLLPQQVRLLRLLLPGRAGGADGRL